MKREAYYRDNRVYVFEDRAGLRRYKKEHVDKLNKVALDAYKKRIDEIKNNKDPVARLNSVKDLQKIRDDIKKDVATLKAEDEEDLASNLPLRFACFLFP